jgi:hypothetical protein
MYFHIAHVALRSNVLHTLRHNVLHVLSHRSRCSTLMYTTSSCIVRRHVLHLILTYHMSSCLTTYMRYMAFVKDKIHPNKAYVDTT